MHALLRPAFLSSSLLRAGHASTSPRGFGRARRALVQTAGTGVVVARTVRRAYGVRSRHCSVCGYAGNFHAYGVPMRFDARCPNCRSLERHRLFALWLAENAKQFEGAEVLHFAPESSLID